MEFESEIEELESRKEGVIKAFKEFGLNLDIAKHPDLLFRLADIGDHFQDAHDMARMIDKIWDKLDIDDADRDSLLTATLLHDIGKAGPVSVNSSSHMRQVFRKLFPHGVSNAKTFNDLTHESGIPHPDLLAESLSSTDAPLTVDTPAIDFWRRHVDWTFEVLQASDVDEKIVRIAASHHILEGKNPAHLADEEIHRESKILEVADKYHAHAYRVLAIVDKYQAIRERGAVKTHEETIAFLHQIVDRSRVADALKADYHEIIDNVFSRAKSDLAEVFSGDINRK